MGERAGVVLSEVQDLSVHLGAELCELLRCVGYLRYPGRKRTRMTQVASTGIIKGIEPSASAPH